MQPELEPADARDDIDRLWDAFLAGQVDRAGAETLLKHLEHNPAELQRRRSDARMHACLSRWLEPPEQNRPLVLSVQARLAGDKPRTSSGRFKQSVMTVVRRKSRHPRHRRPITPWLRTVVLVAAALVIVGIFAVRWLPPTAPAGTARPPGGSPAAAGGAARLTVLQGQVHWPDRTQGPAETLPVPLHTAIRLDPQARATLTLPDGSALELSAQAVLTLQQVAQGPRLRLDFGTAEIQVARQPVGTAFEIQTPHATATVLGTRFTVDAYDRVSNVSVREGSVRVSSANAQIQPVLLAPGDEVRADASGLGTPLRSADRRILAPDLGHSKAFTDPLQRTPLPAETFRGMALQHLACFCPDTPEAVGYCGWEWPVSLAPDESYVEIWIRPRKVVPRFPGKEIPTVVLLANLGTTEYRLGEVQLAPDLSGWMLLRGHLNHAAPVNWLKPGTDLLPLQPEKVLQLEIRNEQADMEFDHSGLVLWRRSH